MISTADFFAALNGVLRNPDSLLAAGYKVILTFADYQYVNAAAMGDTLAKFMELGGGVVMMVFGDMMIAGRYSTQYMPIPVTFDYYGPLWISLGTVYHPESPIMQGVDSLACGDDGNASSVRSNSNVERIADWSDGHVECATFDSSGVRTAYLSFFPIEEIGGYLGRQWVRQIDNVILWTVPPFLSVAEPPSPNPPSVYALSVVRCSQSVLANDRNQLLLTQSG